MEGGVFHADIGADAWSSIIEPTNDYFMKIRTISSRCAMNAIKSYMDTHLEQIAFRCDSEKTIQR